MPHIKARDCAYGARHEVVCRIMQAGHPCRIALDSYNGEANGADDVLRLAGKSGLFVSLAHACVQEEPSRFQLRSLSTFGGQIANHRGGLF